MKDALELPPFRTAVWNMYYDTPVAKSAPALKESMAWGVTLWLCCESGGKDRDQMFKDHGLKTASFGQWRVAWDPKRWDLDSEYALKLSSTAWFATGSDSEQYTHGQFAKLVDKESGDARLILEAGNYHTPAGIQVSEKARPERRYQVFVEALLFLAAHAQDVSANGVLYGGDDNWDEDGTDKSVGIQTSDINTMLGRATGLRQIQAGVPTFGNREIDDYRVLQITKGGHVKPTGLVKVIDGRGAEKPNHQMHMREWTWHNVPKPAPTPVEHACPACGNVHTGVVTS